MPPINTAPTAAVQGQYPSGLIVAASVSKLPPLTSRIKPPAYQTSAAKIFKVWWETVNKVLITNDIFFDDGEIDFVRMVIVKNNVLFDDSQLVFEFQFVCLRQMRALK